jgi:RNA polymerase sigma-32 factor
MTGAANGALTPDGGLALYIRRVHRFPMLDALEERALATRYRGQGDPAAGHRLVTSYLRLVVKVAMSYRGYGLPIADMIAEGNIGLLQAVKGFDPDRGFRLSTYAVWWIRSNIQKYILNSWSLVKIGTQRNHKKLFFGLRRAKHRIQAMELGELSPDQVDAIAVITGASREQVVEMDHRLARDSSLNAEIAAGSGLEWQDALADETPSAELTLVKVEETRARRAAVIGALDILNARERQIVEARRLSERPTTLDELAHAYGVSKERIRQIERQAVDKLRIVARRTLCEADRGGEEIRAA